MAVGHFSLPFPLNYTTIITSTANYSLVLSSPGNTTRYCHCRDGFGRANNIVQLVYCSNPIQEKQ